MGIWWFRGIELMIGPGTAATYCFIRNYTGLVELYGKVFSPGLCSCNSAEQQRYYRHGCVVMQENLYPCPRPGHNSVQTWERITAMIASYGTILPARQVAWGHLFNIASLLICYPLLLWLISITQRFACRLPMPTLFTIWLA